MNARSICRTFLFCSLVFWSSVCLAQTPAQAPATPQGNATQTAVEENTNKLAAVQQQLQADQQSLAAQQQTIQKLTDAVQELLKNGASLVGQSATTQQGLISTTTAADATEVKLTKANDDAADLIGRLKAALGEYDSRKTARSLKQPLGDYIPCLFDDKQNDELRARPTKGGDDPLTSAQATALTASVATTVNPPTPAGQKVAAVPANVQDFIDHVKEMQPILAGLTHDQASFLILQQAAADKLTAEQVKPVTDFLEAVFGPATYDRPDDVSCSFSVLQWHETSDVFGRRVANDYVGIEVNIRNLNKQNEFLVHDIQIAVDTGLSPYQFGRFEASRDKQVVRGVVQRGQTEDRRNLVLNSLTAIGAILTPINAAVAQTIPGAAASDAAVNLGLAVSIFQGPVLAGLANVFPDHTVEYINHLNDLAFSPSSTNKTVVPVQGSVPLITFLAEKPLEQLPFVHCGETPHHFSEDAKADDDYFHKRPPLTEEEKAKGGHPSVQDLNCQLHPTYKASGGSYMHDDYTYDMTLTGRFQKANGFKHWQPAALNIFKHRVFVVVGGVHIQEVTGGPVVTSISGCLMPDGVNVDLSHPDTKGDISCTLSGSHLDQVASVKLEQGTTKTVAATAKPAADGNTATMVFKASDLSGAAGSFEIFLTVAGAKDVDSSKALNVAAPAPAASPNVKHITYNPTTLDKVQKQGLVATVEGSNLDRIVEVKLIDLTGNASIAGEIDTAHLSSTTLTATFAAGNVATLTKSGKPSFVFKYSKKDDKAGTELSVPAADAGATIQAKAAVVAPVVAKITKITCDPPVPSRSKTLVVTVTGTNLDRIKTVVLVDSAGGKVSIEGKILVPTKTSMNVQFTEANLKKLGNAPVLFEYTTKDDKADAPPTAPGANVENVKFSLAP